jgi:hypothetical protein
MKDEASYHCDSCGLGDHILLILFHVFERWRNNPQMGFENAI